MFCSGDKRTIQETQADSGHGRAGSELRTDSPIIAIVMLPY